MPNYRHIIWLCTIFIAFFAYFKNGNAAAATADNLQSHQSTKSIQSNDLAITVAQVGHLRVLVQLKLQVEAEGNLRSHTAKDSQRAMIAMAQAAIEQDSLQIDGVTFLSRFETLPLIVMEVDPSGLSALENRTDIAYIVEDEPTAISSSPSLESSRSIIGAQAFHSAGYTGSGSVVAILDTGVDIDHSAFTTGRNRIVAEGCFSTQSTTYGGVYSVCPDGVESSTQPGAADDCIDEVLALELNGATTDCKHGTHVAGIIGANDGDSLIGIAPDVDLIPVQVFSAFSSYNRMLSFTSDQIRGLEYILTLTEEFNIVAVNMSLGGSYNPEACDFDVRRQAILNLHSVGVATVIAAGNDGYRDGVGKPGCIEEAVTVGSTNDNDTISAFSNISDQIDLLAPGSSIRSTFPNEATGVMSGTSMAAPIIAGSFALLSESDPDMTLAKKLETLQESGKAINDQRSAAVITGLRRVDLESALTTLAGDLHIKISAPPILFHQKTETVSLIVLNDSDLPSSGILVSTTVPAAFDLIEHSISNGGVAEDKTIHWKNLSLGADQSLTLTFEAIARDHGDFILSGDITDQDQRSDRTDYAAKVEEILACNQYESFEDGLPPTGSGWIFDSGNDGQIRQTAAFQTHGDHSLVLEDSVYDGIVTLNSAEIKIDASNTDNQHLDLNWMAHGIYASHPNTGIFMSTDRGTSWFKIATPSATSSSQPIAWQSIRIDLNQVAQAAEKTLNSVPFVRFQFMGDGSIDVENPPLSSGLIIDDVQINCGGPLVWDGEAGTTAWSNPDNWSPNLRPNGNDLRFDGSSTLASEVDTDFTNPIGDLIITANWQGTLTQTQSLTITGDFMQKNGLVIVDGQHPFSVDGSYIFIDGALQQTKIITTPQTAFLEIKTQDKEHVKQDGLELRIAINEGQSHETTLTMTGATWGQSECANVRQTGEYGINRCFQISTSEAITTPITTKIWLEDSEITNAGALALPGSSIEPGEGITPTTSSEDPVVQLMSFTNANWVVIEQFQLGQEGGRPFIEVEIDQPGTLVTQKIVEAPLAVTLSTFQASSYRASSIITNLHLISITLLLLLMTIYIYGQHKKSD